MANKKRYIIERPELPKDNSIQEIKSKYTGFAFWENLDKYIFELKEHVILINSYCDYLEDKDKKK